MTSSSQCHVPLTPIIVADIDLDIVFIPKNVLYSFLVSAILLLAISAQIIGSVVPA